VSDGVRRGENAVGSFRNDYATRAFRQTSLMVDPPGRPAARLHARGRETASDAGSRHVRQRPFNTFEDFTLYDRCITRGIVGSVLRVVYGNGNRIVQGPGMVAFSYEMIHDTRVLYTDGRPHLSQASASISATRGRAGRRRARGRDDEPHRQDQHRRQRQRPAPQRPTWSSPSASSASAPTIVQYQFTVDDPVTYAPRSRSRCR
jgi:hypothetical protein